MGNSVKIPPWGTSWINGASSMKLCCWRRQERDFHALLWSGLQCVRWLELEQTTAGSLGCRFRGQGLGLSGRMEMISRMPKGRSSRKTLLSLPSSVSELHLHVGL